MHKIANALNCELEYNFILKDSGEKILDLVEKNYKSNRFYNSIIVVLNHYYTIIKLHSCVILDYNQMMLEAEERGWERAEEQINKWNAFLIHEKRFEDLERSTRDKKFQKQLMLNYGI